MAKILVTGGAGYVGSVCAALLLQQGHEVTILDNMSGGHRESVPSAARLCAADIADQAAVNALLIGANFEAIFHFAARIVVSESAVNPGIYFQNNLASGIALLESARAAGIRKFVFSSTAAVYGNPVKTPIPEDHPKAPVNPYGESKLAFERVLEWYAKAYGWGIVAFRYFNASGALDQYGERHEPETHVIPLLLRAAAGDSEFFSIYGTDYPTPDGTCLRDYVHVADIAEAHLLALKKIDRPGFEAYNIGTGKSYSVREVYNAVARVTGIYPRLREEARRPGDPAVLCADPSRLLREMGWRPQRSDLDNIVATAWDFYRKELKGKSKPLTTTANT